MKTPRAIALAAAALLLGGCGHHAQHHADHLGAQLHQRPVVYVKAGVVSVSPEPVVVQPSAGDKSVTWQLPGGTIFGERGIEVLGRLVDAKGEPAPPTQKTLEASGLQIDRGQRDAFRCRVSDDRRQATCTPTGKAGARGVYKYLIQVMHDGKTLLWDPNILHLD